MPGSHCHLALPSGSAESASALLDLLVEDMFDSWERLLAMQVFLNAMAGGVAKLGPFSYDRSRTKDQVFAPTTAAPVSAAAVYALLAHEVRGVLPGVIGAPSIVAGTARDGWRTGRTLSGMPAPRHAPSTERGARHVA
jgi:hypothetical protein